MLTLQRRQLVGHDILLARHGNHICSMRVDRPNGRVVALLDDGTLDSAPNVIAPDLDLPLGVDSLLREDWKLLAAMSGAAAAFAALMVGAAVVIGSALGETASLEILSAYPPF
ncbi:hypothetical protein ACIQC0_11440 [Pseudarthrobacter sp. NPDC092419]|uniref:hypothetical protein n=1 Tax=Pseudarthrobacter sp. NPDC092419 TaxID=3364414 RepID=UPI00381BA25A